MNSIAINELSVLIVEPSITSARFIQDLLNSLDVRNIEFCSSGSEALASIHKYRPDLVASAMYLPDMTATDLVSAIRKDPQIEDLSFMLISTETSIDKLEPIRQAGIIAILPKPFSTTDLRRALIGTTQIINAHHDDETSDLSELNVLVVDDSPIARKYICHVLNSLGIENIIEAKNGSEAVGILERKFFDMVFTDYNMPEMDGNKLTRYIREESLQSSIPVLMITSEQNESRLAAVQQAGVSGICDKPFDPDTVLSMIRKILAK